MTPKEKAAELVEKFIQTNGNSFFAKQCALIVVDEIIKANVVWYEGSIPYNYWQKVKTKIKNL